MRMSNNDLHVSLTTSPKNLRDGGPSGYDVADGHEKTLFENDP